MSNDHAPESVSHSELLQEIKGLRADLASGVTIRPPSTKTIVFVLAIIVAAVPGGNAIATRIMSALAGAPQVSISPPATSGPNP